MAKGDRPSRLIYALRMPAKRRKIAITKKGKGAIAWTNPYRVS